MFQTTKSSSTVRHDLSGDGCGFCPFNLSTRSQKIDAIWTSTVIFLKEWSTYCAPSSTQWTAILSMHLRLDSKEPEQHRLIYGMTRGQIQRGELNLLRVSQERKLQNVQGHRVTPDMSVIGFRVRDRVMDRV